MSHLNMSEPLDDVQLLNALEFTKRRILDLRKRSLDLYLVRQKGWSETTFGAGPRTEGICKHITKELDEIRQKPGDLVEWIDVMILALDGYWRAGGDPFDVVDLLEKKQAENFARQWPARGTVPEGEPVEHVRDYGLDRLEREEQSRCQHYNLSPAGTCVDCGKALAFLENVTRSNEPGPVEHVRRLVPDPKCPECHGFDDYCADIALCGTCGGRRTVDQPKCGARIGGVGLACELAPCHGGVHQAGKCTWTDNGPVHELDDQGVCKRCGWVEPF